MAYSDAINQLKKELFSLHPDNEKFYNLIEGLKSIEEKNTALVSYANVKTKPNYLKLVFDKNAPATEQVIFALKYLNKVSKASTITSAIREFDPAFDKMLSTPFWKLKEAGLVSIFNPTISENNPTGSNHQVYYGLKEWFKGENNVKEDYLPEELEISL